MKKINLEFPLPRTHRGLPLGNGSFGALLWGADDTLKITVSRNDFWDRRFGKKLPKGISYKRTVEIAEATNDAQKIKESLNVGPSPENECGSSLIPGGRFEFKLKKGLELQNAELNCSNGELKISFKDNPAFISVRMSPFYDMLLIEDKRSSLEKLSAIPAWKWIEDDLKERGFEAPSMIENTGWIQDAPENESLCALGKKNGDDYGIALTLGKDQEATKENAEKLFDKLNAEGASSFIENAEKWWKAYWEKVPTISIPDEFLEKMAYFAQYKFACAANPNAAKPCPLQGPWLEEYRMPSWGGDYTFNVNIQQIYSIVFYGGNLEHLEPLFDMLESEDFYKTMQDNAENLLGIKDGLLLTHSVNDKGRQCQLGFSPHSAFDQFALAWLAQYYWLYYKHTLDKDFLKERAYPLMKGTMRTYEAMLEEKEDGSLSLPLSVSPEYGVSGFDGRQSGRDSSAQLAAIHMLLDALLEASDELGEKPRPFWKEIKSKLPLYNLWDGKNGKRIGLWDGLDLEVSHRHHSHLASIYPFDSLGEMNEEKEEIIKNTINHWLYKGMGLWSEWCFPWAAIIEIRMGMTEAPALLLNIWKELFVNESMATVYLPKFEGFTTHRKNDINLPKEENEFIQLDGTMGCASAVYEMLTHTYSGTTKIFPGTPEKWKDISFSGIRIPGPFSISAKKENGKFKEACIESLGGKKIKLDIPGETEITLERKNEKRPVSLPVEIDLANKEKIKLYQKQGDCGCKK